MKKSIVSVLFAVIVISIFIISANAATPAAGYTIDKSKRQTNIKWTMTEEGTLTFEIDTTDTEKVSSTSISNFDPITQDAAAWNKALPSEPLRQNFQR